MSYIFADLRTATNVQNSDLHAKDNSVSDRDRDVTAVGTPTEVEKTSAVDLNTVGWDGPDDPANPLNFSASNKIINVGIVSALTFVTPLASSMFAPGVPEIMVEFNSTSTLLAGFVLSIYVLGLAVGPLILVPASKLYGRVVIYHLCKFGFIIFSAACAVSTDIGMLTVFRFFQGCFGSAPVANGMFHQTSFLLPVNLSVAVTHFLVLVAGGGTIADLIVQEKRGGVIAIYALGPLLGPVIGPVAGGYFVAARGWRWVFRVLTILGGFFSIISLLFLRGTYTTVLLERKTARLIRETGNTDLRSKRDAGLTVKQLFMRAIIRPTKILIMSPIVSATSIYVGVVYGYQYLMFGTFTEVFQEQYGISTKNVGLTFLGFGVGLLLGLFVIGIVSDRILKAKSKPTPKSPSRTMKPEYRLPPLAVGTLFIPAGLFMYGWSAQCKTHWIVPIIGTTLVGIGSIAVFMCMTSLSCRRVYHICSKCLAANTVVRSLIGALLPLAGQSMYASLGLGWGNSLLGFIAVVCVPVPWVLMEYGDKLRLSFDVNRL
ncbi:MAG: hypothetical protein Q9219_001374 [cf. Caloplaca sp. 3 TL-2023]